MVFPEVHKKSLYSRQNVSACMPVFIFGSIRVQDNPYDLVKETAMSCRWVMIGI